MHILRSAALLLLGPALLAASQPATPTPSVPTTSHVAPREIGTLTEHRFQHEGVERAYRVYRPAGYQPGGRAVMLLHGGSQSMRKIFVRGAAAWPAWRDVADRENTLLIIPNGFGIGVPSGTTDTQRWNDLRFPDEKTPDDTSFLAGTLARVHDVHKFDPMRVHAFGSSSGGLMLLRALSENPELVRTGVAALAALPESMPPRTSTAPLPPILFINGEADRIIPAKGGTILDNSTRMRPVADAVHTWESYSQGRDVGKPTQKSYERNGTLITEISYSENYDTLRTEAILIQKTGHQLPSLAYPPKADALTLKTFGAGAPVFETAEVAHAFFIKNENRR